MVRAPENRSQGTEAVLPGRAEGKGTGHGRLWKERAPSVSVALRAQLESKRCGRLRKVPIMIKAAQLEGLTNQCILKMLYSMRLSHTHVCLSEMAKLLMALCTVRRDRLIAYCRYVAMLRGKPNGHTR